MNEDDTLVLRRAGVGGWRLALAEWVEAAPVQRFIVGVILLNAVLLGLETSPAAMDAAGAWISVLDDACLGVFVVELALKIAAYGRHFFRSGWRIFDLLVVGIALVPGAGPWAVLRALRVLRVLRLLTVVPSLRRVVAAFLHAIPGLMGVVAVMGIFFYTAAVLATQLFGQTFPDWFGGIGRSLYSLFQIMTLESWSMGIVRPVMEVHPGAWAFFVPFIMIATFTILNLFIGIIVSTMQELAVEAPRMTPADAMASDSPTAAPQAQEGHAPEVLEALERLEAQVRELRGHLGR
ncbi:ion transporter [Cellulomonas bogoriensis]|uniref:Voltage-gated sodium channel n=1 Tax=Cellulomonas bogoriensis 69B4 = DSM 16987 TaxID=1386082 RepID=A0A0A0BRU0_9CELL|nr:ion transporter [Cellulomonas bogoriensis]KGM10671.1 voltage-gated sodium channel [Cellulomonas bogoriensis 69B4 = DSM 16987]